MYLFNTLLTFVTGPFLGGSLSVFPLTMVEQPRLKKDSLEGSLTKKSWTEHESLQKPLANTGKARWSKGRQIEKLDGKGKAGMWSTRALAAVCRAVATLAAEQVLGHLGKDTTIGLACEREGKNGMRERYIQETRTERGGHARVERNMRGRGGEREGASTTSCLW